MLKGLFFFAALIAACYAQCSGNGVLYGDDCACYSDYAGPTCENVLSDICLASSLPTVAPLNTTAVAELINYVVSNDYFSFAVSSPSYQMRYFSDISINHNSSCAYPGTGFFTHTIDTSSGCNDLYWGNFSVQALVGCGWEASNNGNLFEISGPIHVTAMDNLGVFRGVQLARTTSSFLSVSISIPNTVTVNTTQPITVLSAINPTYAITSQVYDPNASTLAVVITTSVQYPYQLNNPVISGSHAPEDAGTGYDETLLCPGTAGTACWQDTTITWSIVNPDVCDVSGSYSATWNYGCTAGFDNCPVDGTGTETAAFTIVMDNPCPVTTVTADISGSLNSYSDGTFGTQQMIFVAGQTMYFQAVFTSDVTIQTIGLADLVVTINDGTNTYSQDIGDSRNTFYSDLATLGFTSSNNGFGFTIMADVGAGNLFDTTDNSDAVFTFQVSATFDITYKTTFGRKRNTVTENFKLNVRGVLDGSQVAAAAADVKSDSGIVPNSGYKTSAFAAVPIIIAAAGLAANL